MSNIFSICLTCAAACSSHGILQQISTRVAVNPSSQQDDWQAAYCNKSLGNWGLILGLCRQKRIYGGAGFEGRRTQAVGMVPRHTAGGGPVPGGKAVSPPGRKRRLCLCAKVSCASISFLDLHNFCAGRDRPSI